MRTFVYRARFEPGKKRGVIVVSFPDVPEAITEGRDEADAMSQAQEALGEKFFCWHTPSPPEDPRLSRPRCGGLNERRRTNMIIGKFKTKDDGRIGGNGGRRRGRKGNGRAGGERDAMCH